MSTIKWSPVTAMLNNQAPGTIVCGSPGSGKTFAMLNFAANALGMGQRVIIIDPKNDFDKLLNVNPHIDIIDINDITPDALNPLEFLKKQNPDGTTEFIDTSTLMTIVEIMTGKLSQETLIAITPIITDFVNRNKQRKEYVNMSDVAEYLYMNKSKAAQAVGTSLKMYYDNKYGPLMFSKSSKVETLKLSASKSMIITLHGMELPAYDKQPADYSPEEKFTSAIVYVLTRKLLDILKEDVIIPRVFICDEAHILFGNREMANVIDKFLTLGRSLNCATILASQGISHFPETTSNYVTTKFLFKSSIDEAQAFLDRFDTSKLDPTNAIDIPGILSEVTNFTTGQCFMIDRKNRNGVIKIKSNYDIDLLTSNPLKKKRKSVEASEEETENEET